MQMQIMTFQQNSKILIVNLKENVYNVKYESFFTRNNTQIKQYLII